MNPSGIAVQIPDLEFAAKGMTRRLRLVNPNSDENATRAMCAIAQANAPCPVVIEGTTSMDAARLISDPQTLAMATTCLIELFDNGLDPLDGVIVAAFGDPGVSTLARRLAVPVVGIAAAAMMEAAALGPFVVCTTTPELVDVIHGLATALGLGADLLAVRCTSNDPTALMADTQRLERALAAQIDLAVREDGARAVIIGGGPLASAARRLARISDIPIIEPVPAAVRSLCSHLGH